MRLCARRGSEPARQPADLVEASNTTPIRNEMALVFQQNRIHMMHAVALVLQSNRKSHMIRARASAVKVPYLYNISSSLYFNMLVLIDVQHISCGVKWKPVVLPLVDLRDEKHAHTDVRLGRVPHRLSCRQELPGHTEEKNSPGRWPP